MNESTEYTSPDSSPSSSSSSSSNLNNPSALLNSIGVGAQDLWRVTPATLANHISDGLWNPAEHLLYISKQIAHAINEGLSKGNQTRTIINVPPRHGKSQLLSIWTPVWILEHWPEANIILASYGADLSNDFSLATRDIILANEDRLSIRLRKDRRQIDRWMTTKGGGMFAVGIGGPITGRGANVLLIDDYIKNANEAASPAQRKTIFDWLVSTALTRLEPGAPVFIVATRWHPDDAAGRLAKKTDDTWNVIKLPAIAETGDPLGRAPGEALWSARYPINTLEGIKRTVGNYFWKALYQQAPVKDRAGQFSGESLKIVDVVPPLSALLLQRSWDLAATEPKKGTDPDYTVGTLMGYHMPTKITYILDIARFRKSPAETETSIQEIATDDGTGVLQLFEQEPGSAGKNLISTYARHVLPNHVVKGVRTSGNKFVRAQPYLAAIENKKLVAARAPWNDTLKEEITDFPDGDHDDQIDSGGLGYWGLTAVAWGGPTWGREVMHITGTTMAVTGVTWGRQLQ